MAYEVLWLVTLKSRLGLEAMLSRLRLEAMMSRLGLGRFGSRSSSDKYACLRIFVKFDAFLIVCANIRFHKTVFEDYCFETKMVDDQATTSRKGVTLKGKCALE